jgi:Histidine kinase-, DNA gyrase B-, and HSP90-like ATPase
MRKLEVDSWPPWKLSAPLSALVAVCLVVVIVWCLDILAQGVGITPIEHQGRSVLAHHAVLGSGAAGSRLFQVLLKGGTGGIELTVQDWGVGFEPEAAVRGRGLGLASMKERLKLVDGQLSIHSRPRQGTTIQARVPFNQRTKSVGAAG